MNSVFRNILLAIVVIFLGLFIFNQVNNNDSNIIKIGAVLPLSGEGAVYGQSAQKGIDLAVEKVNRENNKFQIEVIYEDDQFDPVLALSSLQKLKTQEDINYAITLSSVETLAICPVVESEEILLLTIGSAPNITNDCGKYTFRNIPSDSHQGKVLAREMHRSGNMNVAVMYINNDYGAGLKDAFIKNFDGDVSLVEAHNPGNFDFRTQLLKVKQSNPDAIVLFTYVNEAVNLFKQRNELGLKQVIFSSETLKTDEFSQKISEEESKNFFVVFFEQYEGNEFIEFKGSFKERYGIDYSIFSDYMHDHIIVFADLIGRCGNKDDKDCAIKEIFKTDVVGTTGRMVFDENGDIEDKPMVLYRIENGEFVLDK